MSPILHNMLKAHAKMENDPADIFSCYSSCFSTQANTPSWKAHPL